MKASVIIRQTSFSDNQTGSNRVNEKNDHGIDCNRNEYIYTKKEIRHPMKIARTLKLSTTSEDNETFHHVDQDFGDDTISRLKKPFRKTSSSTLGRKTSIARIGSAFRDLQQTVKPRKSKKRKTNELPIISYNEQSFTKESTNKTFLRSVSLPNIKNDKNTDRRRNNSKKNTVIHKLSNSLYERQNKSTPILDFETSDIISFPTNRLESYRTKSQDHILSNNEELSKINARRLKGRSRSVQLSNDDVVAKKLNRERSFSTDCDDHLFSFDKLVERRLNSSKETQLCETDL